MIEDIKGLAGKECWDGLIHWIKATMLKEETISKEDIDLIKLTDDPKEVLSVINAHRDWKINMIKKSMGKKENKRFRHKENFINLLLLPL